MRTRVVVAMLAAVLLIPAAGADAAVKVRQGKAYGTRIFPDNYFSVRDKKQLTGRRVAFRPKRDFPVVFGVRHSRCTSDTYSICDGFIELNKLDGFDPQPRVTVPFTGSIKLDSVNDSDF